MIELERTFLAGSLPDGLADCQRTELLDIYFPESAKHPHLRLRKKGDKHELTKKRRTRQDDASSLQEETIELTAEEFDALAKADGKRLHKIRHYIEYKGKRLEVDIFQERLAGLVLVDVEFDSEDEKNKFEIPDFCLAEVTQEDFLAGGMLCGKSYEEIKNNLEAFGYSSL